MGLLTWFSKRRAFRMYGYSLPQRVQRKFGPAEHYTAEQVRETLKLWDMEGPYDTYGYLLLCDPSSCPQFALELRHEILNYLKLDLDAQPEAVIDNSYQMLPRAREQDHWHR